MELNNKEKSFTLVELLTVISVIAIITIMSLIGYQGGKNELSLQRAAHKAAQDIRRASEMAMSAKEFAGSVPSGGYGIHFNTSWTTYYKLYADISGNEKYGAGDVDVENITLEKGVNIQSVSPGSLSINFKPPSPNVRVVTEAGVDSQNATITLALESDPAKKKIIKINSIGLIDVE